MISKALDEFYRLVVVSRRNIDLLGKCSTREGSRMCSARPKLPQIFANLKKNELHHRQYQQYHQHYNQRLLRLRLIRHHRRHYNLPLTPSASPPSLLKCRSAPLLTRLRLVRHYNSLAFGSTIMIINTGGGGRLFPFTTYSPPFGRFVIQSSTTSSPHRRE